MRNFGTKQKSKSKIIQASVFIVTSIGLILCFATQLFAAYRIKKAVASTVSALRSKWLPSMSELPLPHIDADLPFTLKAVTSSGEDSSSVTAIASYNPDSEKITAAFAVENSYSAPRELYAFFDKSRAGITLNDKSGTYYTVPAKSFKSDISSGPLSSFINLPSFVPDDISFSTVKDFLSIISPKVNKNEININKVYKAVSYIVMHSRFSSQNAFTANNSKKDETQKYMMKFKAKDLAKACNIFLAETKLGLNNKLNSIITSAVSVLGNQAEEYYTLYFAESNGTLCSVRCITPQLRSSAYSVDLNFKNETENIDAVIFDIASSKEIFRISFAQSENSIAASALHSDTSTYVSAQANLPDSLLYCQIKSGDGKEFLLKGKKEEQSYTAQIFDSCKEEKTHLLTLGLTTNRPIMTDDNRSVSLYKVSLAELLEFSKELSNFSSAIHK